MVLSVKTKDIVEDLHNLRDLFDFSNLNREHKLFNEENKKVVGKFKIEFKKIKFKNWNNICNTHNHKFWTAKSCS